MTIFLYTISAKNPDTMAVDTIRISSEPYTTKMTDTPANTRFDDRLDEDNGGGSFECWMFQPFSTFGQPSMGAGSITLNNEDGVLDQYRKHGFDNRTLVIETVEDKTSAYSTKTHFKTLTIQNADFSLEKVDFQIRDPQYLLTLPAQEAVFAGTNADGDDTEGLPETIQGLTKPFIYGKAYRFEPPMINTMTLMYGINFDADGNLMAIKSVDEVLDGGNPLVKDTAAAGSTSGDYTTVALLAAATIAAGKYCTCLAKGVVRVQTRPTFVLQVTATEGTNASDRTMAQVVKRLLTDRYGISSYNAASVTALDSDNNAEVGIWVEDQKTGAEIITELLQGDLAFCLPNISSEYYFGRLIDPADGTPIDTITENESLDEESGFKRVPLSDQNAGLPPWRTSVKYLKYNRVLSDIEIAGALSQADREAAKNDFRVSAASVDTGVSDVYLSAPTHEIESLFITKAAADTAATRMQGVRGMLRDVWVVPVQSFSLLQIGSVITLESDRYGLDAGVPGVIIGYTLPRLADGIIEYGVMT